jgi:hypothetical protein
MSTIERTTAWMNWFTRLTFESDYERVCYTNYVYGCFEANETPLWPLEWRKSVVYVPRRPKHRAEN